jgi:hypothetical protein
MAMIDALRKLPDRIGAAIALQMAGALEAIATALREPGSSSACRIDFRSYE